MKILHKYKIILIFLVSISLLVATEKSSEAGGLIDIFWSAIYRVGDLISRTSVGLILETIGDSFLRLFGAEIAGYVRSDYWGALTGTLSEPVSWSVSMPGKNQPFLCQVLEPRMVRNSTSLPWRFDEPTKKYLDTCGQQAINILTKPSKNIEL